MHLLKDNLSLNSFCCIGIKFLLLTSVFNICISILGKWTECLLWCQLGFSSMYVSPWSLLSLSQSCVPLVTTFNQKNKYLNITFSFFSGYLTLVSISILQYLEIWSNYHFFSWCNVSTKIEPASEPRQLSVRWVLSQWVAMYFLGQLTILSFYFLFFCHHLIFIFYFFFYDSKPFSIRTPIEQHFNGSEMFQLRQKLRLNRVNSVFSEFFLNE